VARFSSVGVEIRYVLPVLWMTSCFHAMCNEPESSTTLCLEEFRQVAVPVGRQCLVEFVIVWHRGRSLLSMITLFTSCVQDASKSRDLPVLREFRDVIPSTLTSSSGNPGEDDRVTSPPAAVDQSESLLRTRRVTCSDLLMTSRGGFLLATGCTNGDVIVWDVYECAPYRL